MPKHQSKRQTLPVRTSDQLDGAVTGAARHLQVYISSTVAAAPTLTQYQRDRLATLLALGRRP